jgi:hypothetical protein
MNSTQPNIMKNIITFAMLFITLFGCSEVKELEKEQTGSENLKLDGFWLLSSSQYKGEKTSQQSGCLIPDAPIESLYQPDALGSHLLIKEDSISFFRYPYAYYGTFKYEVFEDSLFIKSDFTSTYQFLIQKNKEDTVVLNFEEEFTSTCLLSAEARYQRFIPNLEVVNKLLQYSISCDSLIGKWWYLRKEIAYEDGMDPTILPFPKGMPDSIFASQEIINQDLHTAFIELELDHKMVKMLIKQPNEFSFSLSPKIKNDKILFSNFYAYEKRIDTIYYDVLYQSN